MRKLLVAATILAVFTAGSAFAKTVRIGVTPGPHAQIMEKVKEVAGKNGLELDIQEFSDYVIPNMALADGALEANSFQHKPYLDNQVADRGFKIESVALTVNFPIGIYSKKHKSLDALPNGATISIPNDPTNGGRALILLQDKGLIKLKDGVGYKPTPLDVTENTKKLKFVEIEAAKGPRVLADVDAAIINTNYATSGGLDPVKDPIARENPKGPYVNLIAVRTEDKNKPWVKALVESYHTPEVKQFIEEKFKGSVLTSW